MTKANIYFVLFCFSSPFPCVFPHPIQSNPSAFFSFVGNISFFTHTIFYRLLTIYIYTIGTNLECEYSLRCFGVPTEDIPRTCTGKIKTKYLAKWVKVRTAMDDFRRMMAKNNYNAYYATLPAHRLFPGIECPEVNCVLFRLAGLASRHPGNVEFRLFLQEKESEREKMKTLRQKDDYLHQVIKETYLKGFRFLVFDENRFWYNEITDYEALRKHIFQAQRDIGKRAKARASVQLIKSNTAVFISLDGCGSCKKQNQPQQHKTNKKNRTEDKEKEII